MDDLGPDALGIGTGTKSRIVGGGREVDTRQKSIFGKDGHGVEEETGDVEKIP